MKDHNHEKTGSGSQPAEKRLHSEDNKGVKRGEDCRCKEAEGKTISQILKIMVNDLAFWKKDDR